MVDVILHDRTGHHDDPDETEIDDHYGRGRLRRATVGGEQLGIGIKPDPHRRANVQPEFVGGLGVHHNLVTSPRIRPASLHQGDPILFREIAVGRALENRRFLGRFRMCVEMTQEDDIGVEPDGCGRLPHVGEASDGTHSGRVVPGVVTDPRVQKGIERLNLGRIGAGRIDRKRGLRPSGARDSAHGQAADQTDQEDDRRIAEPTATEGGPESIGSDPKDGAHAVFGPPGAQ
jgi:hypothetical protein